MYIVYAIDWIFKLIGSTKGIQIFIGVHSKFEFQVGHSILKCNFDSWSKRHIIFFQVVCQHYQGSYQKFKKYIWHMLKVIFKLPNILLNPSEIVFCLRIFKWENNLNCWHFLSFHFLKHLFSKTVTSFSWLL